MAATTHGADAAVTVEAPARLHLGFLDLHGGLGRRFGSLGMAIEGLSTRLVVRPSSGGDVAEGPERRRVLRLLPELRRRLAAAPVEVTVARAIPAHAGLGSGTQLGLALAAGLARLHGVEADLADLASAIERGARSGIGLGTFQAGGVVLDGGKGAGEAPPPVIGRVPFPADWRVLLLFDGARQGLSGAAELAAFAALPPFPEALAGELCRHAVMAFLPGLATADLALAGPSIGRIQRAVGDHFAAAQGGRFTSPVVATALQILERAGVAGIGQSSWGPTGFALFADEPEARYWQERLPAAVPGLTCEVVAGRNRGAVIARAASTTQAATIAPAG